MFFGLLIFRFFGLFSMKNVKFRRQILGRFSAGPWAGVVQNLAPNDGWMCQLFSGSGLPGIGMGFSEFWAFLGEKCRFSAPNVGPIIGQ